MCCVFWPACDRLKSVSSQGWRDTARLKEIYSSLVCADVRLNICFSFTQDRYKGFLLRHNFPTYVIYCVKVYDLLTVNDREKAAVGVGGGEPKVNNLVYTKRQKDIYATRKHETTSTTTINPTNLTIFLSSVNEEENW